MCVCAFLRGLRFIRIFFFFLGWNLLNLLTCDDAVILYRWDRLPFFPSRNSTHRDLIELNFILSNFNSYNGLDTDDDSAYFHMKNNVLHYGHMLKSDFSGQFLSNIKQIYLHHTLVFLILLFHVCNFDS